MGITFAVLQGVFSAFTTMLVRGLSATEKSTTIVMWQSLLMTLFTGATLPFLWVTPTAWELAMLLTLGLIGGVAQVMLTEAYASAQVSALGPYSYTSILWATGLGIVVFGTWPGLSMLAGAAMIIAAGLYILHREMKRTKR
jgi:drug/metabolite transporter (DMT)-like permease